jgi:glucosylceramidase
VSFPLLPSLSGTRTTDGIGALASRWRALPLLGAGLAGLAGCGSNGAAGVAGKGGADASTPDAAAVVLTDAGTVEVFQTSRAGDKFADKGALPVLAGTTQGRTTIALSTTKKQEILGFGGALTEASASVLASLSATARKAALDAYFTPDGSGYTLARTHIASCDFSLGSYQYSMTADPTLADFSVAHDEAALIPLIKDAVTSSGGTLKILSSPWSAPAWMKSPAELYIPPTAANGYSGTDPVLQAQYFDAYALYLSKYIQAYKAEGINIWALTPQNEPLGNGGSWETMAWSDVAMNTFLRDNLGPRLKQDGLDVKIFAYDHNKGTPDSDYVAWARTLYTDPNTNALIYGSATHWYGSTTDVFTDSLEAVHTLAPTKPILATEGTLDGLTDQGGKPASMTYEYSWLQDDFYWTKDEYDWGYWWAMGSDKALHPAYEPVYRYARDIIVGLNHWYAGWIDWNIALDKDGGPNHVGNWCGAGMMIDETAQTIYYTPIFYVMRHFSKYIRPGATVLASTVTLPSSVPLAGYDGLPTDGLLATAAVNTDGSVVVVVFNETAAPIDYAVTAASVSVNGTAPAQSLQTLVWSGAP